MNLALEYMLRTGDIKSLLYFPFSFFVHDGKVKKVITLQERGEKAIVRQWELQQNLKLFPGFKEYIIDKKDIFSSPHVTLPGHYLINYKPELYQTGEKQYVEGHVAD